MIIDHLLDRPTDVFFWKGQSVIEGFAQTLNSYRYTCAFRERAPVPLWKLRDHVYGVSDSIASAEAQPVEFGAASSCAEFIDIGNRLSAHSAVEWATQLKWWENLVENGRRLFGERWALFVLANASAGIRSKEETGEDALELHDSTTSLCQRTRYARLHAGASVWWEKQLSANLPQIDLAFTLLVLLTWAGNSVVEKLITLIDTKLRSLENNWWAAITEALQSPTAQSSQDQRRGEIELGRFPEFLSARTVVAISGRVREDRQGELYARYLKDYDGDDQSVYELCQRIALYTVQSDPASWDKWLPVLSSTYSKGAVVDRYLGYRFLRAARIERPPLQYAQAIVDNADSYPIDLVAWADQTCRDRTAEQVAPVGLVAQRDQWFT